MPLTPGHAVYDRGDALWHEVLSDLWLTDPGKLGQRVITYRCTEQRRAGNFDPMIGDGIEPAAHDPVTATERLRPPPHQDVCSVCFGGER